MYHIQRMDSSPGQTSEDYVNIHVVIRNSSSGDTQAADFELLKTNAEDPTWVLRGVCDNLGTFTPNDFNCE